MTVRGRLTTSTALIALAAVLVLGIPLGAVEAARVRSEETARLEREADAVAGVLDDRLRDGLTTADLAPFARGGHRITVVIAGRTVSAGPRLQRDVITVRSGVSNGAAVTASAPAREVRDRVRRSWVLIAALGIGGIALATALAALQAGRLSRPLERLAGTSALLGDGDFSVRAPRSGVPEIDAIARALDDSAHRIAELVAGEREFSSNVSHQLRTPLTALRLRVEEAVRIDDPAARTAELDAALRETDRLERMIADLLRHARALERARAPVALDAMARERVAAWEPLFRRAGRRVTLHADSASVAIASPGTVGQILDVLLDNALHHGAGPVQVSLDGDGRFATVRVQDAGPGVAAADRGTVFDRGATGAAGTGIGLHLARTLARADGGSLGLSATAPSCFELRLRRAA